MQLTSLMLAPLPNSNYVATNSGTVYRSDANGVISNILTTDDQADLQNAGCVILAPPPTNLLFRLLAADFNVTTDQPFIPTFNAKYRITKITAENTTVNGMATAAGGVYTAASKGGSAIVANTQVYTGLTNALTALDLTLALPNLILVSGTPLYFSLTTPHGSAAAADLYVWGDTYT